MVGCFEDAGADISQRTSVCFSMELPCEHSEIKYRMSSVRGNQTYKDLSYPRLIFPSVSGLSGDDMFEHDRAESKLLVVELELSIKIHWSVQSSIDAEGNVTWTGSLRRR